MVFAQLEKAQKSAVKNVRTATYKITGKGFQSFIHS